MVVYPIFISLWCKCILSGVKKERCSLFLLQIAAKVSNVGIAARRATAKNLLNSYTGWLNFERERVAIIKPKNWLPPSPIKIFALGLLYTRKPKTAAARIKHVPAAVCVPYKILIIPNAINAKKESPPHNASTPSIRLNALIIPINQGIMLAG